MWHCEGAYNPGRTLDLGVDYVINSNIPLPLCKSVCISSRLVHDYQHLLGLCTTYSIPSFVHIVDVV